MLNVLTSLPAKKICGKGLSLAVSSGRLVMRRIRIKNVAVQSVVFNRIQAKYIRNAVRCSFRCISAEHHFFIKQKAEQPNGCCRCDPRRPGFQTEKAVQQPYARNIQSHADQNARYEHEFQRVCVAAPRRPENPFALQRKSHCSAHQSSDHRCRHGRYPQIGERHVKTREIRRCSEQRRGAVLAQQPYCVFNALKNSAFAS